MEEKGTIFKPGRLVNAATLGKRRKLSDDERRAVNNAKPIRNKYIEAAGKYQGAFIVHDPKFML